MTDAAIVLPLKTYFGLPSDVQDQIRAALGLSALGQGDRPASSPAAHEDVEGEPVELTSALVRKLCDRLSDKTKAALKVIASSDTPEFHMKDVIAAIDDAETYLDIKAVWSALTRRTRRICDDSDAQLVVWAGEAIYDGDDYVDHVGYVSDLTHKSLRAHFGLD